MKKLLRIGLAICLLITGCKKHTQQKTLTAHKLGDASQTLPLFNLTIWGDTLVKPIGAITLDPQLANTCGAGTTSDTTGYELYWNWCTVAATATTLPARTTMPSKGTIGAPSFSFAITGATVTADPNYMTFGGSTPCVNHTFTDSSGYNLYIEACTFSPRI